MMTANFDLNFFLKECEKNCSKIYKKTFKKEEIITTYIAKRHQICIMLSGEADLIRYDAKGNRTIVEHFINNDIFGEAFYTITTNNELFVKARKNCEIYFLTYDNVINKCKSNCKFHQILKENISNLISNKLIQLNTRVELLTKRSTRDKLIFYFNILSTRSLNKTFSLPMSLTDLVDYLSIDRSAMMRELKLLKEDGIIIKDKNKITLITK